MIIFEIIQSAVLWFVLKFSIRIMKRFYFLKGEEDATYINWMTVKKGPAQRCECGHFFELVHGLPHRVPWSNQYKSLVQYFCLCYNSNHKNYINVYFLTLFWMLRILSAEICNYVELHVLLSNQINVKFCLFLFIICPDFLYTLLWNFVSL